MGAAVFICTNKYINTEIYQFKIKDSEIKKHSSCFRNISGDLFSVEYRTFDASNIIDIHKYFTKKQAIK